MEKSSKDTALFLLSCSDSNIQMFYQLKPITKIMAGLLINNYKIETLHTGKMSEIVYRRFMILEGKSLDTGKAQSAILIFVDDEYLSPNAGVIVTSGALYGSLRIADFRDVYEILRSEKPVFCRFPSNSGVQDWIQITTDKEPVGEGLVDTSSDPLLIISIINEAFLNSDSSIG